MSAPEPEPQGYRCFELSRSDSTWVVQLHGGHHEEAWIHLLAEELSDLVVRQGCRQLVISFGEIECLYSLLLGKLVGIRRLLDQVGGRLQICDVPANVREVFRICKLEDFFVFAESVAAAQQNW